MKKISNHWFNNNILSSTKIKCDCGHIFRVNIFMMYSEEYTIVKCPECDTTEKLSISIKFIFENVINEEKPPELSIRASHIELVTNKESDKLKYDKLK